MKKIGTLAAAAVAMAAMFPTLDIKPTQCAPRAPVEAERHPTRKGPGRSGRKPTIFRNKRVCYIAGKRRNMLKLIGNGPR